MEWFEPQLPAAVHLWESLGLVARELSPRDYTAHCTTLCDVTVQHSSNRCIRPWVVVVVGGYSHIWAIRGCATQQGMVFTLRVGNRVYKSAFMSGTGYTFRHSHSGTRSGWLFCWQNRATNERCCCSRSGSAACLLKHAVSDSKVNRISFSVWNRVAKLCLFSLEQGQVPRHSAAHPHPKLRGPPPRDLTSSIHGAAPFISLWI